MSMTLATSDCSDDQGLDLTVGALKRLKIFAYKHYNQAMKDGAHSTASYWDGYIRALTHVYEAQEE